MSYVAFARTRFASLITSITSVGAAHEGDGNQLGLEKALAGAFTDSNRRTGQRLPTRVGHIVARRSGRILERKGERRGAEDAERQFEREGNRLIGIGRQIYRAGLVIAMNGHSDGLPRAGVERRGCVHDERFTRAVDDRAVLHTENGIFASAADLDGRVIHESPGDVCAAGAVLLAKKRKSPGAILGPDE